MTQGDIVLATTIVPALERFHADWKTEGPVYCHREEHLRRGNLLAVMLWIGLPRRKCSSQ
jgi:hypothetical protein